jgi:hypothetical protein
MTLRWHPRFGAVARPVSFVLSLACALRRLPLRWHPRFVFVARPVWFVLSLASALRRLPQRWHPRYAFVLQASPLCGAAPTFLCRRKEK